HAARLYREELAQVRSAGRLNRRLAQKLPAAGEGAEELVVEVVAVGEHDDRRVLHHRLADDAAGVERHRQALARALRVPHDADAPIARLATGLALRCGCRAAGYQVVGSLQLGRPQRLLHRYLDRMELVVAGHLLDDAPAVVLEDDEVTDKVEEPPRRQETRDHDL